MSAVPMRRRDVMRVCSSYFRNTPREARMKVVQLVADKYGITLSEILSASRAQPYAQARQEAMRQVWLEFGDSSPIIGRLFNRDHTTVLHALGKARARA